MPQILNMQDSFEFTGPHDPTVFGTSPRKWFMAALLILIVVVIAAYSHSRRRSIQAMNAKEDLWTCFCGWRNGSEFESCRKCGKPKRASIKIS